MVPFDNDEMNYTENAWDSLYDTVDQSDYSDRDAELIYNSLENSLKRLLFGDYLKRYIYKKAELTVPFQDVPLTEYQQIIKDAFKDNQTPASFEPVSSKLSALSKNWLSQKTVKRKVVFLLGFGLSMSVDDVNAFLTKALQEPGINAKSPFEVICWYCFKNGYQYPKYEQLWSFYSAKKEERETPFYSDYTIGLRSSLGQIHDDQALMRYLNKITAPSRESYLSLTSRDTFMKLYEEARGLIAEIQNSMKPEKEHSPESVTPSDFENILCSAIPTDRNGNLAPAKLSTLNELFDGKRFSRQHLGEILSMQTEITRFDLITLNFFIFSQKTDQYANPHSRLTAFTESTNGILSRCFMGKLYVQNPYECFILMCILSDDPLGTYADVWEMSY